MATTRGKSTHQLLPPAPRTAGLAEAKSTRQLSDAMAHRRTLDSPPDTNSLPEATYYKKKALKYRRNARFQSLLLAGLALFLLTSWAWTRLTDNDDKIRDRFHPVHARLLGLHPPQGSNLPLPHDLGKANLTERIRDYERFLVLKGRFATEGEDKANVTLAHFGWTLRDAGEALNLVDAFAEECHGGGDNAVKNREDLGIYVEEYLVKPWLREEGGLCGDGAVFEREICEYAIKRFRKQQNDFLGKSQWWWGW